MPKEDNALPKFVQVLSAFGTLVPTAGTALPNLARVLPDFGTLVLKKGKALPNSARPVPALGHTRPQKGHGLAEVCAGRARHRHTSEFDSDRASVSWIGTKGHKA